MRKIFILLISFGIVFAASGKMSIYDGTGSTGPEKQKVIYTQPSVLPPATDLMNWVSKTNSPDPGRYWCPASGAWDGIIYFLGGAVDGGSGIPTSTNTIYAYNTANNSWITTGLPNLLTPRRAGGGGRIGNKIYVCGGRDATTPMPITLSSCEEFDIVNNTVTAKTSMPAAKWAVASAVAGGKLYIIGDDNRTGTTYEYDPVPVYDNWTTKAPIPIGRGWAAAAGANGKIYVFGGINLSGDELNDCWEFDPNATTNAWTRRADMPGTRIYHSACSFNDAEIYVLGGCVTEHRLADNIVYKYHIASNTWTVVSPMLAARGWLMANQVGDKIYATFGSNALFNYPTFMTVNEEGTYTTFNNDVGVERIVNPGASHTVTTAMIPQALVINYGSSDQTNFTLTCEIRGADQTVRYSDSKTISLNAGSFATVSFNEWTPQIIENCNVKMRTILTGDEDPTNDEKVQITSIIGHVVIGTGTNSEGDQPMFRGWKYSTHEAIYLQSEININTAGNITHIAYYKDWGDDINPIENVTIYLKHTTVTTLSNGNYSLTGYTQVFNGSFTNNATQGWMDVQLNTPFYYNYTTNLQILVIKGYQLNLPTYPNWRYTVTPNNRSRSFRWDDYQPEYLLATNHRPDLRLFITDQPALSINIVGNGSVTKDPDLPTYAYGTVVDLEALAATGWTFTGWSGDLAGSTNPTSITMDGNKTVTATFTRNTYTIVSSATSGGTILPLGTIYVNNGGNQSYTMTANTGYQIDSVKVDNVNQGAISSYTFNYVGSDHTIVAFFSIFPWIRKEDMPSGLQMSYVGPGAAMVGVGDMLYALRGNGTREFYRYNGTQWQSRAHTSSFVSEGGALCYNGGDTIYALRGGGAKNFWAYSISRNRWSNNASAPVAINNGSSIVYLDGKVYLIVGGRKLGDLNFFAYNTANNKWTNLTSAPTSPDNIPYGSGSCIVEFGGQIYALKGSGNDNYFWVYNVTSDIWTAQPSIPQVHPQRGVATTVLDGGAMTSNGEIYAIKGGSSNEFWKYVPGLSGAWTSLDTIPRLNALSVPYSGAALAYASNKVWLLKGNNLPEFWQFIPAAYRAEKTASDLNNNSVQSLNTQGAKLSAEIKVLPNPINKQATIRYTVPMPNNVTIKLYNATGRVVEIINDGRMNTGSYTANLSANNLAKGVYFLRYNDTQNQKEIKVIIE